MRIKYAMRQSSLTLLLLVWPYITIFNAVNLPHWHALEQGIYLPGCVSFINNAETPVFCSGWAESALNVDGWCIEIEKALCTRFLTAARSSSDYWWTTGSEIFPKTRSSLCGNWLNCEPICLYLYYSVYIIISVCIRWQ